MKMKKLFCIIFSLCIFSNIYAEEIPYEYLSNSLIEKLQKFALNTIEYYSMYLYNSNSNEALLKTKKNIDSFKTNKDNCSQFIYFWWYMWAPQSGRGFVENAKLTKGESFSCCLIGETVHKNKELAQKEKEKAQKEKEKEKEDSIYSKWITEGIPSSVSPNQPAVIQCHGGERFTQFISDNRGQENYRKSLSIKINKDGTISCLSSDEKDIKLLELLNLRVSVPACYVFDNTGKSIPMESVETIEIKETRTPVWTKLISGQYEASIKFIKSTSKWDVKITKDYLDEFKEDTAPNTQKYLEAVSQAISSSKEKIKKYIKFHLLDSSLKISCSRSYEIEHMNLPPIAIIDSSQSGFAKVNNW